MLVLPVPCSGWSREERRVLTYQLHEGGVADAALQAAEHVKPLPPLPQRRQVCVLHNTSIWRD